MTRRQICYKKVPVVRKTRKLEEPDYASQPYPEEVIEEPDYASQTNPEEVLEEPDYASQPNPEEVHVIQEPIIFPKKDECFAEMPKVECYAEMPEIKV